MKATEVENIRKGCVSDFGSFFTILLVRKQYLTGAQINGFCIFQQNLVCLKKKLP